MGHFRISGFDEAGSGNGWGGASLFDKVGFILWTSAGMSRDELTNGSDGSVNTFSTGLCYIANTSSVWALNKDLLVDVCEGVVS